MIPPIDNSGENVIYINPGHISDDLTLFTTLAHEGYPGHLYQTGLTTPPPNTLRFEIFCHLADIPKVGLHIVKC